MKKGIVAFLFSLLLLPLTGFAKDHFQCSGTEPFWGLTLGSSFTFTREGNNVQIKPVHASISGNTRTYSTETLANATPVKIVIKHQNCSNGMSDQTFDYHVTFNMNGQEFNGCCVRGKPEKVYK